MADRKPGPHDDWIEGFDWKGDESQTVQCLDCQRAVSFPFGQQQHGTHRIVVPDPVVEKPDPTDGGSSDGEGSAVALPVVVCATCGAIYEESVPFCSRCGTETEPPDTNAVIEALRQEVASLRSQVAATQEEYVTLKTESHDAISSLNARLGKQSHTFTWRAILPQEKWTVAWGVWWRIAVAVFLLNVVMLLLAVAVINGGS